MKSLPAPRVIVVVVVVVVVVVTRPAHLRARPLVVIAQRTEVAAVEARLEGG